MAFTIYAEPRFTQDIDLVVDREALSNKLENFFQAIQKAPLRVDEQTVSKSVRSGKQFQILHLEEALKADVYPRELIGGELSRSVTHEVMPGLVLPLASRSDLAISKLIWISKGSGKSRRDLRQIMLRASQEEHALVRQHAIDQGLVELLDEVLNEPDEIDM